jgi:hypothetical protein
VLPLEVLLLRHPKQHLLPVLLLLLLVVPHLLLVLLLLVVPHLLPVPLRWLRLEVLLLPVQLVVLHQRLPLHLVCKVIEI